MAITICYNIKDFLLRTKYSFYHKYDEQSTTGFNITIADSDYYNIAAVGFGGFPEPSSRRALAQFPLRHLCALDDLSVLCFRRFAVILFEVSVEGS